VKTLKVMLKDLRLMSRDRAGLAGMLAVPIVVIIVIAAATQSVGVSKNIVFPIVNEDEGPIATALINSFRKHLDVHVVSRADAIAMVKKTHQAPAALILPPELSKRYLAQQPVTVQLLTDPAQWQQVGEIKVAMLVAEHDAAAANDPLSQELLSVKEESLTGLSLSFSSLEQNIPGFSLMFVLLTLLFSVSLGLREEEIWTTSIRLAIAPVSPVPLLGGKLLARWVIGTIQLLSLLLFGHFVYGLALGNSPLAILAIVTVIVASMTCFAAVVAVFVRTREQAVPVALAVSFVLASLGGLFWPVQTLPQSMQQAAGVLITTWSMSGLQDVMLRARGLAGIYRELLVLLAYAFASFLIALRLFRYGDQLDV
jgi:ABC-type multidrug transport system permease subunit